MGGIGSSRWVGALTRTLTSDCLAIGPRALRSVRDEIEHDPGGSVEGAFLHNGRPVARWQALLDRPTPSVRLEWCALTGEERSEDIDVAVTEQYNGGKRWRWTCPDCETRRDLLYLPHSNARFLCRECHNLAYPSQNMSTRRNLVDQLLEAASGLDDPDYSRSLKRRWKSRDKHFSNSCI